jgi:hypothetical protein
LACSTCSTAGPDVPMGKNSYGSSSRQAARWRQSMAATLLESVAVIALFFYASRGAPYPTIRRVTSNT